ncbi:MAG: class I mannose-6-phosphate isomerase [Gemmiger sp.]|nr:class I mannose-6-phosphate isomerase [Gemmiger sp.]
MPILKLKPTCTDYIWGGERLRTEYHIDADKHPLAEAWVLSCHPDGPSTLVNGPEAGTTLAQYIATHGRAVLGTNCAAFEEFPILVKFIDAKNNLSIQVHPSNAYALAHEGQYGKTEMWYVLDCEPGAFLYYGFAHEIDEAEFARRIADNTLLEVLNAVPVHKGDVFFIPAGTLHAICKGIVLAEVQQNSNVTYRVYDYGRLGADGKPRALHIPQALAVTERKPPRADQDFGPHLARCEYFTTDLRVGAFADTCDDASFTSLLVVDGEGQITAQSGETLPLQKGDSLFLPAGSGAYQVEGNAHLLCTRVGTV